MQRMETVLRAFLKKHDPDGMQRTLRRLWRHWPEIVDEHIAEIARPIGHRKRILLIGVEDSMVMQDLTFYAPYILEQVNAFLGTKSFDKVLPELIRDRVSLDLIKKRTTSAVRFEPSRPQNLGSQADAFDANSAVARCYAAYVKLFNERGQNGTRQPRTTNTDFPKEEKTR
ncbi:hypothetical protein JCM16814_19710 [Desulfobaculum senezii]|uniref:DUF721 domain-containing protein n=1 Tax=Desulfobaculum sp. SPO524 TaxID=3378071 RepID=UPI0038522548